MSPGHRQITSIQHNDIITTSSCDCRRVAGALKCQEEEEAERGGSSSREQEKIIQTWSKCSAEPLSPGSQVTPAAPPAEEAEPEEDSE